MKTLKKVTKIAGLSLAGLIAVLTATVGILERRTWDAPTPAITASQDPQVIARGRYLVHGPAHCVECHGDPGRALVRKPGEEVPLSGGVEFPLPIGTFRAPNLTADRETGIGAMTDGQIARSLRHGVRRDGRALAPFMPFAHLSDEDLAAIISYLRTQAPVTKAVDTRSLNPLGHAVAAFMLKPTGPTQVVPARVTPGPTAEYGRYLVHSVGNCAGCHTDRDLRTGQFTGPTLAGGLTLQSHEVKGLSFVTPNLTPDPRTGRIANWTEEVFVARFQMARGPEGTPMPWKALGTMKQDDLRAIYRYLRSLKAVEKDTGEAVRPVVASH